MMRASPGLAAAAAVLLGWTSLASQGRPDPPAPAGQPPIRTGATFVRVDVYPTRDGAPVDGLTATDFEVREEGVLQAIRTFEHVVIPIGPGTDTLRDPDSEREMLLQIANPRARVVAVFLDVNHVDIFGSHYMIEPLVQLMRQLMGPEDLVGVMTPDMAATQVIFARKPQVIEEQLRKHWDWGQARDMVGRPTEREIFWELCYPPRLYGDVLGTMIAKSREAKSLEAMQDLVRYLGGVREERKAIVAVSNGWRLWRETPELMDLRKGEPVPGRDKITVGPTGQPTRRDPRTTSGMSKSECDQDRLYIAQLDNYRTFQNLLTDAVSANASFYPIDPRGLVAGGEHRTADRLLELADNTQGMAVTNSNNLASGVQRVVRDLTSYYLLGYNSTNTKQDGRFRRIEVRLKEPGIQLRHRRGYRAPDGTTPGAMTSTTAASPSSELAMGLGALSRTRPDAAFLIDAAHVTVDGQATIWIAGELMGTGRGVNEFLGGGRADVEIQAGDRPLRAQATIEPGARGFVATVQLPAESPLEVDIRARIVGEASIQPLSAMHQTRIGPGLAGPLVFHRGPATGNKDVPAAARHFSRSERIRIQLPLAGSAKAGPARLLDRQGKALPVPVTVSERVDESTGQRWAVAELALAPLAAADYAIEQSPEGMGRVITAIRVGR